LTNFIDDLIPTIEQEYIEFVLLREGEEMPRKFIQGYLKGSTYLLDRKAYIKMRELHEDALKCHKKDQEKIQYAVFNED
jgi:hypothetical protein